MIKFENNYLYTKQFELVRILFGVFVFFRTYYDLEPLFYFAHVPEIAYIFAIVKIIVSVCIIFGFLTPLSLLLLLIIQFIDRSYLGAFTLGEVLVHAITILLFLGSSGMFYSLDYILLNRLKKNKLNMFLCKLYDLIGKPTKKKLNRLRFMGSYTYAFAVMAAGVLHLYSVDWMSGRSIIEMYSSNYNSKYGDLFTYLFKTMGTFTYPIIIITTWVLTIWQITFFIGISFRKTKKYFIYFGLVFHTLAFFLMNLGWLIPFSLLLYILIYFPLVKKEPTALIYDDKCGFCENSVKILTFIDIFHRIKIIGSSKINDNFDIKDLQNIMEHKYFNIEILGLNNKKEILYGADLYLYLFTKIDLLRFFYPIYYLFYKIGIADRVYKYIAQRRLQISAKCNLKVDNREVKLTVKESSLYKYVVYPWFIWLMLSYSTFLYFNIFEQKTYSISNFVFKGKVIDGLFSISKPSVFNKSDTLAQRGWIEIYDDKGQLIPFYGKEGERLSLHESRVAYFNTIRFRRRFGDLNISTYKLLVKKILFFYEKKFNYKDTRYSIFYSYRGPYEIELFNEIKFNKINKIKIAEAYIKNGELKIKQLDSVENIERRMYEKSQIIK